MTKSVVVEQIITDFIIDFGVEGMEGKAGRICLEKTKKQRQKMYPDLETHEKHGPTSFSGAPQVFK